MHFLVDGSCRGILSGSSPSGSAPVPPTSHCSPETDLGASTQTTGEQTLPSTGLYNHRAKRRPCSTSSAGSGHHNTNHTPYQGDISQHTMRKDVAGIHTKNSPCTKNIKLMEATQGCSHMKTPLQDNSRHCFSQIHSQRNYK